MKPLGLNEIREKYLVFFESKGHLRMKSHSLIPENDNSLLLINSGMAPLKPFFTGQETPPKKRVATCQKCIRTGDIENVGKTARHGTFFEMLGNFSFGDYFKEEIIPWSWEFCVDVLELPEDKLYVSIYEDDDEAFEIWNKKVGLAKDRIFRMGKDDNFWEVGQGPCGPCSELYFDRGEKYGCKKDTCTVGCDCDRYMEFWNLVFTQFDKKDDGSYEKLLFPNIDTGMGLERMAVLMQDAYSIFDVDTAKAVRAEICKIAGVNYMEDEKKDVSIRVITDHAKAVAFLTGDGVIPSNEGRGYVLRRLIRRAVRHGKLLGINNTFMAEVCKAAIEQSGLAYPELTEKIDYILKVVSHEEERFYETLDNGMEILKSYIEKMRIENRNVMSGDMSFKLYDTYGFPMDITKEMLEEIGFKLDEESFKAEMENQKSRARSAREETSFMGAKQTVYERLNPDMITEFSGYGQFVEDNGKVLAITIGDEISDVAKEGDEVSVFIDKSPFYAESGGQAGDVGTIKGEGSIVEVIDCIKTVAGKTAHIGVVKRGEIKTGDVVRLNINKDRRMSVTRNHSATHMLHKALKEVLGAHVEQAGSYVTPEKLRFDFTHFSAMTADEIEKVQKIVTDIIFEALPVEISHVSMDEARKMGAVALFSEKYGDVVRVVKMGDFSCELCGGCHLTNTSGAGAFKILSEAGVAAGVRRIEAITGHSVIEYNKKLQTLVNDLCATVKATPEKLKSRIITLLNENKELSRKIESMQDKMAGSIIDDIAEQRTNIKGVDLVCKRLDNIEAGSLRKMGDKLKDRLKSGVVVLAGCKDGAVNLLVMATDDVVKKGVHAGKIVSEIAGLLGGKGGGRPNMAQAGSKIQDMESIDIALERAANIVNSQLS